MPESIHTGNKTFDQHTSYIGKGNVVANTQLSNYIRAHEVTKCGLRTYEPGVLREFDLAMFTRLPLHIRNEIKNLTAKSNAILYEFSHKNRRGGWVVHGYVATTVRHYLVGVWVFGGAKSEMVIDAVLPLVSVEGLDPVLMRKPESEKSFTPVGEFLSRRRSQPFSVGGHNK
jgi:hypothetical protein